MGVFPAPDPAARVYGSSFVLELVDEALGSCFGAGSLLDEPCQPRRCYLGPCPGAWRRVPSCTPSNQLQQPAQGRKTPAHRINHTDLVMPPATGTLEHKH